MSDRNAPVRAEPSCAEPAREGQARDARNCEGLAGDVNKRDVPEHGLPSAALATLPAAILCGGLGTRLRPVVSDRSKVVADVAGRPFLSYLLSDLAAAGVRRAILCTGHQAESVQALYGASFGSLQLAYSQEASPLGTGGALALAARRCEGDLLLALNGDSRCAVDLQGLFAQHAARGFPAALAVCQVPDTSTFGRVVFDDSHRVNAFIEKGGAPPGVAEATAASVSRADDQPVAALAGWVNAGVYLLPTAWLRSVPIDRPVSLERDLLPAWIARGITAFPVAGPLIDIGTPERLAAAQSALV